MTPDLDKVLCDRYPKIFAQRHASPRETLMCWGFSCDDGWFTLIDRLCDFLQFHLDHNNRDGKIPQIVAVQVKEKFGTLRFYYQGGNDYMRGAVAFAESMSSRICEITGEPGSLHKSGGWYKTLSPKKAAELDFTIVTAEEEEEDG